MDGKLIGAEPTPKKKVVPSMVVKELNASNLKSIVSDILKNGDEQTKNNFIKLIIDKLAVVNDSKIKGEEFNLQKIENEAVNLIGKKKTEKDQQNSGNIKKSSTI
eukprot:CAMPEP_0116906886 /NCGR_PEP_ID=MMETSP0467-20121206/12778_1 /TAXON_ID=283647 /ORGANISM="Mesodinium pulex, Strain SPMC105" /LENGTH=104 /DNA_ID=CAMNT_0004581801 /DNA_START=1057 /DNA_END=1371 /DNA_ORIENTATION=-